MQGIISILGALPPASTDLSCLRCVPPVAGVALRVERTANGAFLVADVASNPSRDTTDGLIRIGDIILEVDGQQVQTRRNHAGKVAPSLHTAIREADVPLVQTSAQHDPRRPAILPCL